MSKSTERARRLLAAGLFATALMNACGGETRNRKAIRSDQAPVDTTAAVQQAGPAKKVDPANSGTITGTVKWQGAKPTPEKLDVSGTPECMKNYKEAIYNETLWVNPNDTVKFCFLCLDVNDVYEIPSETVTVDQLGCRYVPHVFAMVGGQVLAVKSSDPTLHNVHYIAGDLDNGGGEKNLAMAKPSTQQIKDFTKPDWIKFKCDVHPWMGAWCAVRSHPFFAVTGDDGTYTIKNVPPGTYTLVLKHEKLGEQRAPVTVETGKTVTQDFTLKQ